MIEYITQDNKLYPFILKLRKQDPPRKFYYEGNVNLFNSPIVTIIGTRKNPTEKGLKAAFEWAAFFASKKFTVLSGLAVGIDTAAHEGALSVSGNTIAVLGTPVFKIYPAKNTGLARRIIENNGLIISEYDTDLYAPWRFPDRDRIQALVSLAVFPIQAPLKSGTFHAYYQARDAKIQVLLPEIDTQDELENPEVYAGIRIMDGITITQENKEKIATLLMQKYQKFEEMTQKFR